ncbi:MAG: efflux RND transporter periplasmic adaptor subunit [Anaerolineae bacterium]|nr:efflux RND transporter periplasmic adaptor subunit [Anaerolineae bacterium]
MIRRVLFLTIFFLAFLALTGCSLLPQNQRSQAVVQLGPTPTPIPTPIVPTKPTYQVQRGEVVEKVKFSGRVAPVQEEELFFRTAGWVRNVYIERDDLVETGQVLADLEIDDLEKELTSKLLDLERAESILAEAERNLATEIRRAEVEAQIAQIRVESTQAQDLTPRQEQVAADLEKAQLALQQAQADYDEIAWRNDRATAQEANNLQQATLDYIQAKADYRLAVQEIENQKYDIAILERELELAQIRLDELDQGIDPLLKNDVERAILDVEKLKAEIADAQIIAPFDGQILSETLTEGREATARKTVAIIADLSELEISAELSSTQLQDLSEGMPVVATLSRRPGEEWRGSIRRLPYPYGGGGRSEGAEEEDQSTRIRLEGVSFEDLDLEVGDLMSIEVILEQKDNVLWLPPQAVRKFEGRDFVVVQDGELQRRVDVKVGIESEDRVEIEEGLTEGQIVVGP